MESVIKSGDAGRNLIAFMTLLDLLDSYSLEHKNGKYKLHGQIDFNVKTIGAKSIMEWNRGMSK